MNKLEWCPTVSDCSLAVLAGLLFPDLVRQCRMVTEQRSAAYPTLSERNLVFDMIVKVRCFMKPFMEKIIQESIEVLNEKGSINFSMRGVAKKLNIHVSTLYYHTGSRQRLVSLLTESICEKLDCPEKIRNPKVFLVESSKKLRLELLKIRDAAIFFDEAIPDFPKHLDFLEKTMEALTRLGIKESACFLATNSFINYTLSFVMDEEYFTSLSPGNNSTPGRAFYRKHIYGLDYESQFMLGLDVMLAGLRRSKQP